METNFVWRGVSVCSWNSHPACAQNAPATGTTSWGLGVQVPSGEFGTNGVQGMGCAGCISRWCFKALQALLALMYVFHSYSDRPVLSFYFQELGLQNAWISETIFWSLFIPFVLWSFSPFVTVRKRFYTAVIYARILMVLTLCQMLRILSFTVTQLPAPNYHCRAGESTAVREMPDSWTGHIVVDIGRQATHGCGDLIFSSHTTFVLVGVLTYTEYGEIIILKVLGWIGVAMMSLIIVASRKHYSVDVIVAWYTVPLVFYALLRRWTTKRPPQDYWPHRPLVAEEDKGVGPFMDGHLMSKESYPDVKQSNLSEPKKPPLMSILVHTPPLHSRQASRSSADLRSMAVKDGASPPPASPVRAGAQHDPNRGHLVTHPQNAQPSTINILPASTTASNRSHRRNATLTNMADSDASGDLESGNQHPSPSFVIGGFAFNFS